MMNEWLNVIASIMLAMVCIFSVLFVFALCFLQVKKLCMERKRQLLAEQAKSNLDKEAARLWKELNHG
jgi:predicted membrane protein